MLDTYETTKSGGGRSMDASKASKTYDPKTRTWVNNTVSNTYGPSPTGDLVSGPVSTVEKPIVASPPKEVVATQVSSQAEADKEYIDVEYNTLEGELSLRPSKKSIKIKTGQTINIMGLGKFLSGLYFVSNVKKSLGLSGISISMTVIKTGFGNSLKGPSVVEELAHATPTLVIVERPSIVEVATPNSEIKAGDNVMIIGDATYSNASEGTKVPEWVKQKILKVEVVSSDGRARLSPINSWTYIRFLQKV